MIKKRPEDLCGEAKRVVQAGTTGGTRDNEGGAIEMLSVAAF